MGESTSLPSNTLAAAAALISDPGRARMLLALIDGRALTAGELALAANLSAQTASNHLSKLLKGNLVTVESSGRHRYYALANSEVAHALESLAALTPPREVRCGPADPALRFARTCYDHLAGDIGVQLAQTLQKRGWIERAGAQFCVTQTGAHALTRLGVDVAMLERQRNSARVCLDWTERKPHIGGALGRMLLDRFVAQDLLRRTAETRALFLTTAGHAFFAKRLTSRPKRTCRRIRRTVNNVAAH